MQQILLNLSSSWKNLHVSIPVALAILFEVISNFDKERDGAWKASSKAILGYAALAAANSGPTPQTQASTITASNPGQQPPTPKV